MAFEEKTRTPQGLEQGAAPEDALRSMVETVVQERIDTEFAQFVGAAPYERTADRRGYRNGSYRRAFTTRVGAMQLAIPRDRAGLFRPSLFAKYERSEQALVLAMIEMYFHGVSTRKVNTIVEQLCGTSVSASEVSALTRKLDATLTGWRERSLTESAYAALIVDAHVEQVRREGHVRGTAALWVVGVTPDGYREHLGVWMGPSESEASWASVFQDLVERGLHGVTYVVSDEHVGLVAALRRYFPEALHQRCQVHYQRNALSKVTSERLQLVIRQGLRDAWTAPTREEATSRLARLIDDLRPDAPRLADWLADTHDATLACYAHERDDVQHKLRTTNALERHHKEVRRRTRVIGIFPHEASLLRLITALAIEQNDRWRQQHWLRAPTFLVPERPMRKIA